VILQELVRYYERMREEGELEPPGFARKEIEHLIRIDARGRFQGFTHMREGDDKQSRAASFPVPAPVKRSSGVAANLLWDNAAYVFGAAAEKKDAKPERLQRQREDFLERVRVLAQRCEDAGLQAVRTFLETLDEQMPAIEKDPEWTQVVEGGRNLTFELSGKDSGVVAEREAVRDAVAQLLTEAEGEEGVCSVTGKRTIIERVHPSIMGVRGAQSSGAALISFNRSAFVSHGKEQNYNAPVGSYATFAYTTALNHLLGRDSDRKIQMGEDTTAVFWTSEKIETGGSGDLEQSFGLMLGTDTYREAEERRAAAIQDLFDLIKREGRGRPDRSADGADFVLLGLAPNNARLAVRVFRRQKAWDVARNIQQHYDDIHIHGPAFAPTYPSIGLAMRALAPLGEIKRIPGPLWARVLEAVISGGPYPRRLLSDALQRVQADHETSGRDRLDHIRFAVIAAWLRRWLRSESTNAPGNVEENRYPEKIQTMLDPTIQARGYLLGRLFAVLEMVQREAIGANINASIRDRFFTSASTRPALVFPRLIQLAQHHLSKTNAGFRVVMEKRIQEILELYDASSGYPVLFNLEDQCFFGLGYYQQKQDLYKKKESGDIPAEHSPEDEAVA